MALRANARFSFLLFWLAYASGALHSLYGPMFAPLARHGREFGLAFAAAHSVHFLFVIWLYLIAESKPIPDSSAALFSLGFVWVVILVGLSWNRMRQGMPQKVWRIIHNAGMLYISYLFAADFYRPRSTQIPLYFPFFCLMLLGWALRATALARRKLGSPLAPTVPKNGSPEPSLPLCPP